MSDLAFAEVGKPEPCVPTRITVLEIMQSVCLYHNVTMDALVGPSRFKKIARIRQQAYYLCRTMTSRNLSELGRRFGGRDHSTIWSGLRKVKAALHEGGKMADDIDILTDILTSPGAKERRRATALQLTTEAANGLVRRWEPPQRCKIATGVARPFNVPVVVYDYDFQNPSAPRPESVLQK